METAVQTITRPRPKVTLELCNALTLAVVRQSFFQATISVVELKVTSLDHKVFHLARNTGQTHETHEVGRIPDQYTSIQWQIYRYTGVQWNQVSQSGRFARCSSNSETYLRSILWMQSFGRNEKFGILRSRASSLCFSQHLRWPFSIAYYNWRSYASFFIVFRSHCLIHDFVVMVCGFAASHGDLGAGPYSPVQRPRKFSAALGVTSGKSSMITRPP